MSAREAAPLFAFAPAEPTAAEDAAERWCGEAVLTARAAQVGLAEVRQRLRAVTREAREAAQVDATVTLFTRLTPREQARRKALVGRVRALEELEAALARVVRRFEHHQAQRAVRP